MLRDAQLTYQRLYPRIEAALADTDHADVFLDRLTQHFPNLFHLLMSIYGTRYDFFYHLEQILLSAAECYCTRSEELKALDVEREADPLWFQSESMMGAVCYVDLFAGNITNLYEKIPYLKELGLTYLHLMPLFDVPEDNNDGGYAVSDYRKVRPDLGTIKELADFATELRRNGISLVLDFVFNHTSDEHVWVKKAKEGDIDYQEYYYMFDDRTVPDLYEQTLREIFPEQAPGSFTFDADLQKWVWTTFYNFQWDLNYNNPAVFNAMLQEMLFLANQGVEVLRLDAVAFIWKQMGTSCEGLPQAHTIIRAYNLLLRIATPMMLFKSEAIVHPAEVASYISRDEAPLSYNPTLMALLWEALATRDVTLLRHSMSHRFPISQDTAWVNYVRVHDDIGWTFADEDASEVWINGYDHRQFLNAFYVGWFEGSFAKGLPFGYNPINKDMRISGTCASLAGLEQALELQDDVYIEHAIRRITLIHSVILSIGGIPLIYLGDEIATLNDYSYTDDPDKAQDSRWVHRPYFDWDRAELRTDTTTIPGQVFQNLKKLIQIRKHTPPFFGNQTIFFDTNNKHIFAFIRNRQILVLGNFSEQPQSVERSLLSAYLHIPDHLDHLVSGEQIDIDDRITLAPYQFLWLVVG